jgi:hypothetical protein
VAVRSLRSLPSRYPAAIAIVVFALPFMVSPLSLLCRAVVLPGALERNKGLAQAAQHCSDTQPWNMPGISRITPNSQVFRQGL